MAKYHINGVGETKLCRASKRPCRFAEESHEHFSSAGDAKRFNELSLAEEYGELSSKEASELSGLREKSFKIKESLPVEVFDGRAVDEVGNVWVAKPYGDGFWAVEAVDREGVHLTQGLVPAVSADVAINDLVDGQRYSRRSSAS